MVIFTQHELGINSGNLFYIRFEWTIQSFVVKEGHCSETKKTRYDVGINFKPTGHTRAQENISEVIWTFSPTPFHTYSPTGVPVMFLLSHKRSTPSEPMNLRNGISTVVSGTAGTNKTF